MDYRNTQTFSKVLAEIKSINPDLIVGSSMGGYFGYLIGSTLNMPTCLFNPAVHRSIEPVVDNTKLKGNTNNIFLGKSDKVITGSGVKAFFKKEGVGKFQYETYTGGHRVPYPVFVKSIAKCSGIKIEEGYIKTFESFINEFETN